MATLLCITKCWLQAEIHSATQITEQVAMDWWLWELPLEEARDMGMKATTTTAEKEEALKCTLLILEVCWPIQRQSYPDTKNSPPHLAWANAPQ